MARVTDIREVRDQRMVYGLPLDGRISPYHPYSYEPTVEMTITARPHEVQALRSVVDSSEHGHPEPYFVLGWLDDMLRSGFSKAELVRRIVAGMPSEDAVRLIQEVTVEGVMGA